MSVVERAAILVMVSLALSACGKKGPLIYPDMLVPAAPSEATAQQSGSLVKLQFTLPDKDRAGRSLQGVAGVRIGKRTHEATRKDFCRSCSTDYVLFRTIYLDSLPESTQRFGSRLVTLDSDVSAGTSYSYSIIPFTSDHVDGALATTADVRVASPLPAPDVSIESLPTEIKLQMASPPVSSGQLLGYNLYRRPVVSVKWPYLPLNREPQKANEYVDISIERGVTYHYHARAVTVTGSGDVIESLESQEVDGMLKEDE